MTNLEVQEELSRIREIFSKNKVEDGDEAAVFLSLIALVSDSLSDLKRIAVALEKLANVTAVNVIPSPLADR